MDMVFVAKEKKVVKEGVLGLDFNRPDGLVYLTLNSRVIMGFKDGMFHRYTDAEKEECIEFQGNTGRIKEKLYPF